jgi:hypothetical protein
VTKFLAELDLGKNRLHFSRAIIHDDDTQEGEMFRTDEERNLSISRWGLEPIS